ncbi:MAG TPA: hypothetical protein VKU87_02400 [Thermomicrobiaceae bacterium]|nr:hypothetical protein [Thermomicrobiaceae bacterium]
METMNWTLRPSNTDTSTFSKPQPARQIEARSRARTRRVRVEVVEPGRHYITRSQSQPGLIYHVIKTSHGWTCDCDGYAYTGCCKHVAQVERRSEREGWRFGLVAPR